ncbi:MAG: hypothetical protein AAGI25_20425 [Bacteroidota bacterium]
MEFPNRFTHNLDLWGYANGASNDHPLPSYHVYPDHYPKGDLRMFSIYEKTNYSGRHFFIEGANRSPNAQYMDIGVLTKVTYPTGGYTSYSYEPHRFMIDGEEFIGGGLRIKNITKSDGQSTINYHYQYTTNDQSQISSGKVISVPMLVNLPTSVCLSGPSPSRGECPNKLSSEEDFFKCESGVFSYSIAELGRTAGSNVGYTNVIEFISNSENSYENGRTEYKYSFPAEFGAANDLIGGDCTVEEHGICDDLYDNTEVHNFFMHGDDRADAYLDYYTENALGHLLPPNPNYDWNRGLLLSKKYYDSSNDLLREETNQYANYFPFGASEPVNVFGIKMIDFDAVTDFEENIGYLRNYAFRVAKYKILTDVAKVLSSTTITDYEIGTSKPAVKTIDYSYEDIKYKNLTRTAEETSTSDKLVTKYHYPFDYDLDLNPEGVSALKQFNISSVPIEVSKYVKRNGELLLMESELTTYKLSEDSKPVVARRYRIETKDLMTDYAPSEQVIPMGPFFGQAITTFNPDDRHVEKYNITKYDCKGNILEFEDKSSGLTTSYVWGYNHQYPIAKVVNASYSEVESVLGSSIITLLNNGYRVIPPSPPSWIPSIDPLTDTEI